jgi:hypothetical protein
MLVLSAFTLEVVPGIAVSEEVTEPDCPSRPERGNVTAGVPVLCAKPRERNMPQSLTRENEFLSFLLSELFAEAPYTERQQYDGKKSEYQKVWPQALNAAAF